MKPAVFLCAKLMNINPKIQNNSLVCDSHPESVIKKTKPDSPGVHKELQAEISKRQKAENELRKYRDHFEKILKDRTADLQRSNEELEQFAHIAAHEIREPLNTITGLLELIKDLYHDKLDDRGKLIITQAMKSARRASWMIRDLLMHLAVDGGNDGKWEGCCTETILKDALENMQFQIKQSRAIVTHDPLPLIMGNKNLLLEVFQNLIGNAIKFCDKAYPGIHVRAEDKGDKWLFAFRDNGIGIEPEDINRLFMLFARLNSRSKYPGSGIGLAVCKKIIEHHGGVIWAESEPGEGSVFYFSIPKQKKDKFLKPSANRIPES